MTRLSICFSLVLATVVVACGGTTYTADDSGTGGTIGQSGGAGAGGAGTGGASSGGSATGGAATGGAASIRASAFNQKCDWDGQCTPVTEGPICSCGQCPNAAINSTDQSAWDAERAKVQCPAIDCVSGPCQEMIGACRSQLCTVREAVHIDGTTFGDDGCQKDADCHLIPVGEICADCQCQFAAVGPTPFSKYEELKAKIECKHGPVLCDCPTPQNAKCDLSSGPVGKCVLATP